MVAIDVDGTLTDGFYHVSEKGSVVKSFYTRDFYAIEKCLKVGLTVLIISQSRDACIRKQIKRICAPSGTWSKSLNNNLILWTGVKDKFLAIKNMSQSSIKWEEVAYIGDAENDEECIDMAGFSGCPEDAIPRIKEKAMYPSDYKGGRGAVYDFCTFLLEERLK